MARLKTALRDLVSTDHRLRRLGWRDPEAGAAPSRPSRSEFACRPVLVDTGSADEKGCLVLAEGRLIAVLVRVVAPGAEGEDGGGRPGWFLEAGFGPCAVPVSPPPFASLADALAWMRARRKPSAAR